MSDEIVATSCESFQPTIVAIPNGDPGVSYAAIPNHIGCAAGDDGSIWRFGSRWNKDAWRKLKCTPSDTGHLTVKLLFDGKLRTRSAHVLTLVSWRGPCPDGMECRHLNGIPSHNMLTNIEWNTRSVNTQDRRTHGSRKFYGEGHHQSLFTDDEVIEMRQRASQGEQTKEIAASIAKSVKAVRKAVRGITYSHLPGAVTGRTPPVFRSEAVVQYIREQAAAGKRQCELAIELDIPSHWISRVVNRKTRI